MQNFKVVDWVGDEDSTGVLMDIVQELLTAHPLRFSELRDATGATTAQVRDAILQLQREGVRVVDVAEGVGKALWFIPSDAVLVRLTRAAARAKVATKQPA